MSRTSTDAAHPKLLSFWINPSSRFFSNSNTLGQRARPAAASAVAIPLPKAESTAVMPQTEPTERSIPPVKMWRFRQALTAGQSEYSLVDGFLVPATAEPFIACNMAGSAEFEEREIGGHWRSYKVRSGDLFVTCSKTPYELRWRSPLGAEMT